MYARVTVAMLRESQTIASDLDGVVEFLLNIRNVELAALLYEKSNGEVKVSMRSRRLSVDRIAVELGGGGHKFAAGCTVFGALSDVTEQVIGMMEREITGDGDATENAAGKRKISAAALNNEEAEFF